VREVWKEANVRWWWSVTLLLDCGHKTMTNLPTAFAAHPVKTHENAQILFRTGWLLHFWEQETGYPTTKTKVVVARTIAK
jgi:hypothetical protein